MIREKEEETQKKQCYELIHLVQDFLERPEALQPQEKNFQDLADWYCELSYTWLKNPLLLQSGRQHKGTYMWGIMLQEGIESCLLRFRNP